MKELNLARAWAGAWKASAKAWRDDALLVNPPPVRTNMMIVEFDWLKEHDEQIRQDERSRCMNICESEVAKQREICAQVAEDNKATHWPGIESAWNYACDVIAAAIRNQGAQCPTD